MKSFSELSDISQWFNFIPQDKSKWAQKSSSITNFSLGQFYHICILPLYCRMRSYTNYWITVKYSCIIFTGTFLTLKGENVLIKYFNDQNKYNLTKNFWEYLKEINGATEYIKNLYIYFTESSNFSYSVLNLSHMTEIMLACLVIHTLITDKCQHTSHSLVFVRPYIVRLLFTFPF